MWVPNLLAIQPFSVFFLAENLQSHMNLFNLWAKLGDFRQMFVAFLENMNFRNGRSRLQYLHKNNIWHVLSFLYLHLLICARNLLASTEDGRSMTTFYYYSVKHQSGLQRKTFSKLLYIFLIHLNVLQIKYICHFIWGT